MREAERDQTGRENSASMAVVMLFGFTGMVGMATIQRRRRK